MSINGKISLPKDGNASTIPLVPAKVALAVTVDDSISTTTEITLDEDTTFIEITAKSGGVYLKWGTSDATSSAWDEYIASGTTRNYLVPVDLTTGNLYTAFNVIQDDSGAGVRIIEK